MKTLLWLDDVRNPFTFSDWLLQYAPEYQYDTENHKVVWVKNYKEFTEWITENGLPTEIGFDHDLSDFQSMKYGFTDMMEDIDSSTHEYTGMDCARWLTNYCMDNDVDLPKWFVQSSNPSGRDNINGILNNFRKYQMK